jgi:PAS domain-containing protein
MTQLAPQTQQALRDLEAALAYPEIPPRVARSFAALAEKLRRPVRVSLLGLEAGRRRELLCALLGQSPLATNTVWPTLEITYADAPSTLATLSDGSTLSAPGLPDADLIAKSPAFLRIGMPNTVLRRITFLYLSAGADPAEQAAALRWAAGRTDISIWCTRRYTGKEASIWAKAPDRLKHHANLAVLGDQVEVREIQQRSANDFDAVVLLPRPDASALIRRIEADIDAALGEDLDTAQLLMKRFGVTGAATGAKASGNPDAADTDRNRKVTDRMVLLSEPVLFLKRQARAIFESLEWHGGQSDTWATEVLQNCTETVDGLRDRAVSWPDDEADIAALRQLVFNASDMAILLEVEGGVEQANDAASLLYQLRTVFERTLGARASLAN